MDSKIYSISELTRRIRSSLERSIGTVWVEGEISNLNYHPSGHVYLTLKDAQSQLTAIMFRGEAERLQFRLKDGIQVQGYGRITVYERRGNYQIVLETVQLAGMGNLQAAFEALKKKLESEGLFSLDRKRALPVFPETVGVVTASHSAALRDFCRILHRRFPGIRIILVPTRVQGTGAAQEIAASIDLLNMLEASGLDLHIDVIAIIRGGGSIEDLWAFNEEVLARAIARSKIPTISGIGHEVDFTICDFVADVRAATPSAAAEILIRPKAEYINQVLEFSRAFRRCSQLAIGSLRHRLMEARDGLRSREPRQFIREWRQRLDDASTSLRNQSHTSISHARHRLLDQTRRFSAQPPNLVIERKRSALKQIQNQMEKQQSEYIKNLRHRLELGKQRLELLSPAAILARGYSITLDAKNRKVIRSVKSVQVGSQLLTKLKDGEVQSTVQKK
jgi:exodeoxyribonuclease VII large subunit